MILTLFISNLALITICLLMGTVMLVLPLPKVTGLKNYKISIYVLAASYLLIGVSTILKLRFNVSNVDYLSSGYIAISSSQAILFTLSIITLFNPELVTMRYVFKQCIPLLIFILLHFIFVPVWGYPQLGNMAEWKRLWLQPTVLLRELFVLTYLVLLVYYTQLFFKEAKKYNKKLDDYCADNLGLRMSWLRYTFFVAVFFGLFSISISLITSISFQIFFFISTGLFYLLFALRYIQYPHVYHNISSILFNADTKSETIKNLNWNNLKQIVITKRLYLKQGVTIEEIAKDLRIGRTTLSTFINNEEGVSFNNWINRLRIEEAKQIMQQNPEYTVAQIPGMVGFSEHSNFSRQFKLVTGLPPSVWRQQQN